MKMMNETEGYRRIKKTALNYVNACKIGERPGLYAKWQDERQETFYGSYHALHILDLFGELDQFTANDMNTWAEYFLDKQTEQGYFSTNVEDMKQERCIEELDPILHSTRGAIWALRILGRRPRLELAFFEELLNAKKLYQWVKSYDWSRPWTVSNQICAGATILMAMRDWFGISEVDRIMETGMYPALEEVFDEQTGFWGTHLGAPLTHGLYGTIHVSPIYFAQQWPLRAVERNVDSTLRCQEADGSFPDGTNCPDFDGAYMIANLAKLTDYRREDLERAARLYLENALMHEDLNGVGFRCHRRDLDLSTLKPGQGPAWGFSGGKRTLTYHPKEPSVKTHIMLDSWFYPLSIGLIAAMLGDTGYEGPYKLNPMSLHECNVQVKP